MSSHTEPNETVQPWGRVDESRTVYVRFHGGAGRYSGRYPDRVLDEWAAFLHAHLASGGIAVAAIHHPLALDARVTTRLELT